MIKASGSSATEENKPPAAKLGGFLIYSEKFAEAETRLSSADRWQSQRQFYGAENGLVLKEGGRLLMTLHLRPDHDRRNVSAAVDLVGVGRFVEGDDQDAVGLKGGIRYQGRNIRLKPLIGGPERAAVTVVQFVGDHEAEIRQVAF